MTQIERFDESDTTIPRSIVSMLRELKNEILKLEDVVSVVLFGSYSKGTYDENSDIDVAVFVNDEAAGRMNLIFRQAARLAAYYPSDIQIRIFTHGSLICPMGIIEEITTYGKDISYI